MELSLKLSVDRALQQAMGKAEAVLQDDPLICADASHIHGPGSQRGFVTEQLYRGPQL